MKIVRPKFSNGHRKQKTTNLPKNIEYYYALYLWQMDWLSIDLDTDLFLQFDGLLSDHLAKANFYIYAFIMKSIACNQKNRK